MSLSSSELAVERGVEWLVAGLVAGRAVMGWEEEGTVAADGVEEELAVVGRLMVGLEVAGTGWHIHAFRRRCRWRRRVLSGGLGQRTCLRFQALAKAVPEAYQLLYPKGLQRLAAQLRERDCCGYLLGQPLNPPAEPAMNTFY
ncbi:hypothetical protein ACK3TF_005936 [Chlorella vulgaris]